MYVSFETVTMRVFNMTMDIFSDSTHKIEVFKSCHMQYVVLQQNNLQLQYSLLRSVIFSTTIHNGLFLIIINSFHFFHLYDYSCNMLTC